MAPALLAVLRVEEMGHTADQPDLGSPDSVLRALIVPGFYKNKGAISSKFELHI